MEMQRPGRGRHGEFFAAQLSRAGTGKERWSEVEEGVCWDANPSGYVDAPENLVSEKHQKP